MINDEEKKNLINAKFKALKFAAFKIIPFKS